MSRTHDTIISNFDLDRLESEIAAVTKERDAVRKLYDAAVEIAAKMHAAAVGENDKPNLVNPVQDILDFRRELAAVTEERDELKSKYRTHHDEAERITNEIRRVSSVCRELREQRDRLAEALREIAEGSPCLECGGGYAMWLAAEALANVKGGNNE